MKMTEVSGMYILCKIYANKHLGTLPLKKVYLRAVSALG